MAPLYMFITYAYAAFFYHLGSGPYWEERFGFDRDSCSTYWWTNLLFINNYYNNRNTVRKIFSKIKCKITFNGKN